MNSMLRRPTNNGNSNKRGGENLTRPISHYRSKEQRPPVSASTTWRRRLVAALFVTLLIASLYYACIPASRQQQQKEMSSKNGWVRKQSFVRQGQQDSQCTIYMAPSSLKHVDGYGIFTTRDIAKGSNILSSAQESDGPSIPVVDYIVGGWTRTWNEYWWGRGVPDHVRFETDAAGQQHGSRRVMDYQFGLGAMPNHHCILNSLKHGYPEIAPYDDTLVDRYESPGTGAFSYSMGRVFFAKKDVQAGDEIFLNYGYCQREKKTAKHHAWAATIPMPQDYEEAALLAWAFWQVPPHTSVNIKVPKGTSHHVADLLPRTTSELHAMVGSSSTEIEGPKDLIPVLAKHVGSTPRTPEWIRSNGMCLEHLVAGKSQLEHAGQGGFAQHGIRRGDIVVPMPLIHIVDKDVLGIYDSGGNRTGSQLLLNYCFGHNESSLLLCPETNALLINHCSVRKKECGPNGPNADYRWSSGWEPRSDQWRKMTIDVIAKQPGRGLSMEIVALRDIEPGEEVFMDYGVEWEKAWEEHVVNWKPPLASAQAKRPLLSARKANEQHEPLELLVTGDLRNVSHDPYLFTGCQYWPTELDSDEAWDKKDPSWVSLKDDEILHKYGDDGSQYQGTYSRHSDRSHWPCTVIRQEETGAYTVRIHQAEWRSARSWAANKLPRLLTNYPRDSIHYFVKPHASDQHLAGVFRHPIGIRDEMFQKQWKNLKRE